MSLYMHTLNGQPAAWDGLQIAYASFYGDANPLCRDLKQIRREQKASLRWREKMGFHNDFTHGHIRVSIPE